MVDSYGSGDEVLTETDLSGNNPTEFIFLAGKRIARRNPAGTVYYFFADHLGTGRVMTDSAGVIEQGSDYYPFGGERLITNTVPNSYKFTGKERDTETGNDYFGARYLASDTNLGRFMTPDWASDGSPVPYAKLDNPQTLNLYVYLCNDPLNTIDPDGHGDWYDPKGKKLGSDGVKDGSVHVAKSVTMVNGLVDVSKTHDMYSVAGHVGNAIQASVGRSNASSANPSGPDMKGGFHEEGFTVDSKGVHNAPSGPAVKPTDNSAHITQTVSSDTAIIEHVHPSGTDLPESAVTW